jgi:type I toxin-antitoxin system toxin SymE
VPTRCSKPRRLLISYAGTNTPGVSVPYLRLRGRWLQDAGFMIGRHVTIEVNDARLMIEQAD